MCRESIEDDLLFVHELVRSACPETEPLTIRASRQLLALPPCFEACLDRRGDFVLVETLSEE
jgi:hypothetical protein